MNEVERIKAAIKLHSIITPDQMGHTKWVQIQRDLNAELASAIEAAKILEFVQRKMGI